MRKPSGPFPAGSRFQSGMNIDPATDKRHSTLREGHAAGAILGVLLLSLITVGVVVTLMFAPLFSTTPPAQVPGHEQVDGAE
jgi:hypothetical protein